MIHHLKIAACVSLSFLVTGCGDPVRRTQQTVRLRLLDSDSGAPIANAPLELKFDFRKYEALLPEQQRLSGELLKTTEESWDTHPWQSCVTDTSGQAEAIIVRAGIDRNRGSKPPAERSLLGHPYLVRAKIAAEAEETLSVIMKPGERIRGVRVTISVTEVREPVYIASP
jgi:hypothetical protein